MKTTTSKPRKQNLKPLDLVNKWYKVPKYKVLNYHSPQAAFVAVKPARKLPVR